MPFSEGPGAESSVSDKSAVSVRRLSRKGLPCHRFTCLFCSSLLCLRQGPARFLRMPFHSWSSQLRRLGSQVFTIMHTSSYDSSRRAPFTEEQADNKSGARQPITRDTRETTLGLLWTCHSLRIFPYQKTNIVFSSRVFFSKVSKYRQSRVCLSLLCIAVDKYYNQK